jgi:hypothetical protein
VFLVIIALAACQRADEGVFLVAPFNPQAKLGKVEAVWRETGEERNSGGGVRLPEPEARFQYRVDVRNRLRSPIFVRLSDFAFTSEDGVDLGGDESRRECVTVPGLNEAALTGEVWVRKSLAPGVKGFRVSTFAVPLSDRGRALYREWLLQRRTRDAEEIDAEIRGYLNAPPCALAKHLLTMP